MLKKFGQVVLDYFLINYPNTYSFKLSVDDYTFSEFATLSGFEEEKVIRAIQKKGTFCCNDLEALAIAVYQVKIVGDVESIQSSGSDSYYQKIRDNYFSFKDSDNNTICNKYFSNQITLWRTVRDLFNKHGRNLEIPEDHPYSGRYVQYPVKSHELKNSELLDWANNFIRKGLKPNDITISYQSFCTLMFPYKRTESYKRTIFNFYKIWDGRSKDDILNHRPRTISIRDLNTVDTKILLDYLETEIAFYNQETGEKISDLSRTQELLYSSSNKVFFIQNDDNDFYSAKKNKIDYGLNFIIVSKNELNLIDIYLEKSFQQEYGKESLYIYAIQFSKESCTKLGIETAQKPPLKLIGGLKKSRNSYYKFGLPVLEFSQSVKEMYVNADKVEINSNRITLSSLPCLELIKNEGGNVAIRFSDYMPINFSVVDIDHTKKGIDAIGWEFSNSRYLPSAIKRDDERNQGTIVGFNSTINFILIKPNCNQNDNKRKFIIRKEYLENRFLKRKEF